MTSKEIIKLWLDRYNCILLTLDSNRDVREIKQVETEIENLSLVYQDLERKEQLEKGINEFTNYIINLKDVYSDADRYHEVNILVSIINKLKEVLGDE